MNSEKTPHTSPLQVSYGYLFWVLWRKDTMRYRKCTVCHCNEMWQGWLINLDCPWWSVAPPRDWLKQTGGLIEKLSNQIIDLCFFWATHSPNINFLSSRINHWYHWYQYFMSSPVILPSPAFLPHSLRPCITVHHLSHNSIVFVVFSLLSSPRRHILLHFFATYVLVFVWGC